MFQPPPLQNNEMPIGVDHKLSQQAAADAAELQNNEMPIGVDRKGAQ